VVEQLRAFQRAIEKSAAEKARKVEEAKKAEEAKNALINKQELKSGDQEYLVSPNAKYRLIMQVRFRAARSSFLAMDLVWRFLMLAVA
jgi:plasmid maintenance system killer protein